METTLKCIGKRSKADNTDLIAFACGGKLLIWNGSADMGITHEVTADF